MADRSRDKEKIKMYMEAVLRHGDLTKAALALKVPRQTLTDYVSQGRQYFPDLLPSSGESPGWAFNWSITHHVDTVLSNGTMLIGSDLHRWPGKMPIAWVAFCAVASEVKPDWIILNGDIIDGARVSRHPRIPGQRTPKLSEEIDATHEALAMLPLGPQRFWAWGNHDYRANAYLINNAPELEDYAGTLQDRFPDWPVAWAMVVNDEVEIRHRFRGGIHAARNNAINAGRSVVTGDTHQLGWFPVDDRNGRRYGVETGMLADPDHPAFEYTEGRPGRAANGFALLTFSDGILVQVELAEPHKGRIWFRGKVWAGQ